MNCAEVGRIIRSLRLEKGMTQLALAHKLGISDKAVSKWERGLGCPDITLLNELADILSVSTEAILSGELPLSGQMEVNMKNNKYFICPECKSLTVCTGSAQITCCGRKLSPVTAVKADDTQKLNAEVIEYEWYISGNHPMTKDDYISFAAFVTAETMHMIKLYPEWDLHFRIPARGHGTLLWYGDKSGLLYQYL